jgi:hypothetical protein
MKFRRFLAYLLVGGCVTIVVIFVAVWVLAGITLRNDPWLEADIRIWQEAYDGLAALPDFAYVSARDDGSFLLHNVGEADQSAVLPEAIADMLHDRDLLGLRKAGDDVFFVTGGAVDDEWGYVITGDSAVGMDGLWQLERVDGHVYRFSTMKSFSAGH